MVYECLHKHRLTPFNTLNSITYVHQATQYITLKLINAPSNIKNIFI